MAQTRKKHGKKLRMMIWKKVALLPCNLHKVRTFKADDDDDKIDR
jgi:hypothetical protein